MPKHTQTYLEIIYRFIITAKLINAVACIQVTLKECDTFDLKLLKDTSEYRAAANSTETIEKIEDCMKVWIKQIEQVRFYITPLNI